MAHPEKQKTVFIESQPYMFRRMTAAKASYIWQRIMGGALKAQAAIGSNSDAADSDSNNETEKIPIEQRFKTTYAFASMYINFDDHEFIQREALKVASRVENLAGTEQPMPVANDRGDIVIPELADNPMLISQIVVESLTFNLSCFLG